METHLGRMSLAEARERLAAGPVALLPFGAQEAHGPHLPLGADYLVAEEVAVRAARQAAAVVAPTMPYGYAPGFAGFPGSVSVRMEITQMLAADLIESLAAAGVRRFVFVDNHGENEAPLDAAARAAQRRLGVAVGHFYPWKAMLTWCPELFGAAWQGAFGHGAEPNTSVMLYLMPGQVRMHDAAPGALRPYRGLALADRRHVTVDGAPFQLYLDVPEVNDTSVTAGDPRARPDPEIGRVLVERCAAALARFVAWFRET